MTLSEFEQQLVAIGAQNVVHNDLWITHNGQLASIRQLSFDLPVLGKTIAGCFGYGQTNYHLVTPKMTVVEERTADQFISTVEDLMFGACTGAIYSSDVPESIDS